MDFVHLQVKSGYSLLSSVCKLEELVKKAKAEGYSALALTDQDVLYGAIPFYKLCKQQGIKPIIGMTVSVRAEGYEEEKNSHSLVLLAKNLEGYRHLMMLSSRIQVEGSAITKKLLHQYRAGLIAITPGLNGEVEQSLLKGDFASAKEIVETYIAIYGNDHFYLSLQDHNVLQEKQLNLDILKLCEEYGIQPVATNDVHYLEKPDAVVHECLLSIKNGTKMTDEERERLPSEEFYFKSKKEMKELFQDTSIALENTVKLAESCNLEIPMHQMILPKFPVPSGEDAHRYLKRICEQGLKERYGQVTENARRRLDYELDIIERMAFSDYFLIVWDFMRFAHQKGILTGPGRGSAAGSLVAYVLWITDVDPIKHDLLFERFLNPERISMPDIDIDFPDTRRDEIIRYVHQKYGADHVAQIITFGTLAARASIRDMGRVMNLPVKDVDHLAKQIPARPGITLRQAYQESPSLQKLLKRSEQSQRLYKLAMRVEGLPRHSSTHAAGVVISDSRLVESVPLQEGHDQIHLTQYSMDVLEEIGLLKMDFLGLRNLTLIDQILGLLSKNRNQRLSLQKMPLEDDKTFRMLSEGDTTGVFQLESPGMRNVLKRLKPSEFEDIVAVNALYRPGPMENIPTYINRKHGKEAVQYAHPDLEPILKRTYGVIVYQEQIMQIASKMAGFSLGQADLLRRAVSKKKKDILDREREHFVDGSIKNGYDRKTASEIYDLIVRFADYGFNRSHAVAYSVIAYQLAYLKANHPLYFTAALMSSVVGNEDKVAQYTGEARHRGIKVHPPSINKSAFGFTVENGGVRFPLLAVKSVGGTAVKEIIAKRKQKPFQDLFDFCAKVSLKIINRRVIEALITAGCFDEFGKDRAVLLASLDSALEYAELAGGDDDGLGFFLSEEIVPKPEYVDVTPFGTTEKLEMEKEALGFYLSQHPVEPFKRRLSYLNPIPAVHIEEQPEKKTVKVLGYINQQRTIRTKKGELMAFLTLSDETGEVELVAFPDTFTQYGPILQKGQLLFIEGMPERRNDKFQVIVKRAGLLEEMEPEPSLYLRVERDDKADTEKMNQVKSVLQAHPGNVKVYIHYAAEQKTVKLSDQWLVSPNEACLMKLKDILGERNVVFKSG